MLAFEVAGGREAGRAIIDPLTLPELTASLGSVHTMVVHPPSTSQRQLSEAELLAAGITPGLLRVSVGLEDVEDLEADLADGPGGGASRDRPADRGPGRRLGARHRDAGGRLGRLHPPGRVRTSSPGSGAGSGAC